VGFQAHWLPLPPMSRRIDIELTSSLNDGTWTWRAAGARQPRGVLDGSILPGDAKVGDELKVEVDQELEGLTVLSVVSGREKQDRDLLALLPSERDFQPVIETRAKRERGERPRRDDGDRRPRRDRDSGPGGPRGAGDRPRRDAAGARDGDRPARDGAGRGAGRGDAGRGEGRGQPRGGGDRRREPSERRGPSFTPPPEIPQRPKPKRLRPGKANRTAVLADLPAEQRPIAELALQGINAVRQRLREENERAVAEGRATMPEASVMKLAEDLLPRLRVAEWRDRAEAAKAQADELDLRDLRSVVTAAGDPIVVRDETTRALADELRQVLVTKQEQELQFWYGDIDAALAVGRVIRALRLSSQPPKAGVPFPSDIAQRLVDSTNASLAPMDTPDRWVAMLEAAAFSPVRLSVRPARIPDVVSDELKATVTRLGPALPQVAAMFEIEVDPKASMPKPLRPTPRPGKAKPADGKPSGPKQREGKQGDRPTGGDRGPRKPRPDASQTAAAATETDPQLATAADAAVDAPPASVEHAQPVNTPDLDSVSATAEPAPDAQQATGQPTTEAEAEPGGAAAPQSGADAPAQQPSTESDPATEAEGEPIGDPAPESEAAAPAQQPSTESEATPVTDIQPPSEPDPATEAEGEPGADPAPESAADTASQQPSTESEATPVTDTQPPSEPDPATEPQPLSESRPELVAPPETAGDPQPQAQPEPATEPRPLSDSEPGPAAEPGGSAASDPPPDVSTEAPGDSDLADATPTDDAT
jgi:hypothetical protein